MVAGDRAVYQRDGAPAIPVRIRRSRVVEDATEQLAEVAGTPMLKCRISVQFINEAGEREAGIDIGGLFKELWTNLSRVAFSEAYGLFSACADGCLFPNPASELAAGHAHLRTFELLGAVLGKALYEDLVVGPQFARFFLRRLLGKPSQLQDLESLDPTLYRGLASLRTVQGDLSDLYLDFTVGVDVMGAQRTVELVPGGASIPVTRENRLRYVHLAADYYLSGRVRAQCDAFLAGVRSVLPLEWLRMFNEHELQVMISGSVTGDVDVADWKAHTRYAGGYTPISTQVLRFWRIVEAMSPAERALLLQFATSCPRAPALGFAALSPPFTIQRVPVSDDAERLPSASTCFNTIKLPDYSSERSLRDKLHVAIASGAGFELS
jgi:ubiquitin-protein ligase E3 C